MGTVKLITTKSHTISGPWMDYSNLYQYGTAGVSKALESVVCF